MTAQKEVYVLQLTLKSTIRMLPVGSCRCRKKFQTTADKDKQAAPVMYLSRDGQTIYYASYGKGSGGEGPLSHS